MVSRAELMKEAKDLGIKGRSKMKKSELEEAIRKAKEMSEESAEPARTPDVPKKMGRGRPKKESPPPVKKAEVMKTQAAEKKAEIMKTQTAAKKAEVMKTQAAAKTQSAGKRSRGY